MSDIWYAWWGGGGVKENGQAKNERGCTCINKNVFEGDGGGKQFYIIIKIISMPHQQIMIHSLD